MKLTRRQFQQAMALSSLGCVLPARAMAGEAAARGSSRTLVLLFLQGGLDGLSAVIPQFEDDYYRLRPGLSLVTPAEARAQDLELDGRFVLHPALAPLRDAFFAEELAIIHATGSPLVTRSHFDAQDFMNLGEEVEKQGQGWLGRLSGHLPPDPRLLDVVALEDALPLSLWGAREPAVALGRLSAFSFRRSQRQELLLALARALSSGRSGALKEGFSSAYRLIDQVAEVQRSEGARSPIRPYPKSRLGLSLFDLASLVRADRAPRIVTIGVGGWDTHYGQPKRLERALSNLAQGLLALRADLGAKFSQVTLLGCTEFGRAARQNGSGGTDHGHGSVAFVYGGRVAGGQVYGRWPGLSKQDLYQGRDLAVTTDFRDVFSEVGRKTFGLPPETRLFGDYRPTELGLLR